MFILPLALSACLGTAICRLFLPAALDRKAFIGLSVFLGIPLGLGLSSVIFFAVVQAAGMPFAFGAALEIGLVVALLAAWKFKAPGWPRKTSAGTSSPTWLKAAFAITFLTSGVSYILYFLQMPHGAWDAFAIWNLKARFLFRLPHDWQKILPSQLGYSHLDYPFLLPASITRAWTWVGSDTVTVPAVIGALFPVCAVGILAFGLRAVANRTAALAGTVFLLGTPLFIEQGASQVADIPLSCYYLATAVLLWLYYRDHTPKLLPLIGCTAALGGWTKNEGNTFFLAVAAVVLIFPWRGIKWRVRVRKLGAFAAGAAPGLIAIGIFKYFFAGPNWMAPSLGKAAVIARLMDSSRWMLVSRSMADNLVRFGGWPVNPVLLVLAGLSIKRLMPAQRRALYPFIVIVMLVLASDAAVYLIAPNVQWLVETSVDRLLLQLWPTCIFVVLALWASTGTLPPVTLEAASDVTSTQVLAEPPSAAPRTARRARLK